AQRLLRRRQHLEALEADAAREPRVLDEPQRGERRDGLAGGRFAHESQLLARVEREGDAVHNLARTEMDAQVLNFEQAHRPSPSSTLRGSSASRRASPIRMRSSSITTSTPKVESEIHHASRLSLPCWRSSPRLGVPGGTPKPRKSRLVSAPMAAAISNGTSVTTGVRLFGRMWRHMMTRLLWPRAR